MATVGLPTHTLSLILAVSPSLIASSLLRPLLPPPSSLLPPAFSLLTSHFSGVDAVGGAEAILSHLVTQELRVPCAHAPALEPIDVDEEVTSRDTQTDARTDGWTDRQTDRRTD